MAHYNSKSPLVVDVKSKEYHNPLLMVLKELTLSKSNKSFSKGRMRNLTIKVVYAFRMWTT